MQCSGCGHQLDETTDPAAAREFEAAEVTCMACAVVGYRQNALQQQAGENSADALAGVRVYAKRRAHSGRR